VFEGAEVEKCIMEIRKSGFVTISILSLLLSMLGKVVYAGSIDLNDFFADPSVSISTDGLSAEMEEEPRLGFILLANDPGLGDPEVILPGIDIALLFDYDFLEGAGENDEFAVFVLDAQDGQTLGADFTFFAQESSAGTISFNLSNLVGTTLGLQFQLTSLIGDSGSTSNVAISNLRLQPIPLPPSILPFE
jgi:hypothetical protein